MKRNGPLITLLAGLAVAAVLVMLSFTAASKDEAARNAAQNAATGDSPAATPTTAVPTANKPDAPATTAPAPTPLKGPVTWAGTVSGTGGSLAIAGRDGTAVAYLCDGKNEVWLQGTALGNKLELTGKNATASATFANGVATGSITVGSKKWTFRLSAVQAPSGLYRASANVRNAKIVGGWVYVNGVQVGAYTVDGGESQGAPPIDVATNTVVINGETIPALPLDGGTPLR